MKRFAMLAGVLLAAAACGGNRNNPADTASATGAVTSTDTSMAPPAAAMPADTSMNRDTTLRDTTARTGTDTTSH